MRTPALLAWSGGKDAAWTLHELRQRGALEVVGLLSTITREDGRSSMQGVRREVLRAQARAAGLPLLEVALPAACGNDAYEAAMTEALVAASARWPDLRTVAFGDLFLADIRAWREQRMARIGWRIETPLFGRDTAALARAMIAGGLRASLCCIDTQQLDARFAGHAFDEGLLDALPAGVDPCGERGEFHTCVHDGPMFDAPLALVRGGTNVVDERFARTDFALAGG
ncbi:ATP-binding protein [Luteimonas kalidii]|uniref:ATP-binding protein n=1 Tax=Luteimonas kalidii TaxID=3042025 RepID=A0ABT6JWV9_9GAMM|nr:ATP-binding protein [Luteimonas kalidii]MDH5835064.1 ATP-binding protein [Luteimonas kalidii]